ncbi:hypothetical protein GGI42DRAFT_316453 [Trichoderma sp. SZMC 28013]
MFVSILVELTYPFYIQAAAIHSTRLDPSCLLASSHLLTDVMLLLFFLLTLCCPRNLATRF